MENPISQGTRNAPSDGFEKPDPWGLSHVDSAPGRLNGAGPVAIIDIGSNSIRLVVYERAGRSATPLFNEKELCGLARGVAGRGRMRSAAVDETLAAIRRFVAICQQIEVSALHVLATAAVRESENGPEFISAVEGLTGAQVAILSGAEEARLSALGVISGFTDPDGVAGDLGGGSLEIVDVAGHDIGVGETFPLGGIRLEETSEGSPKRAEKIAAEMLEKSEVIRLGKGRHFYAIGGTWRSLARLHMRQKVYPLNVMHNYVLEAEEAAEFCRMVARTDLAALGSISVVSRARRSLLPYGAAVLEQIVKLMKPETIVMSALGVREGLLYDLLDEREKQRDPLIAACEELAYLRSRSPEHVRELVPWTGMVFREIGMRETPNEERLRHAACLLSDIGWRSHPEYRGLQSTNLVANAAFIGVDHPGRAYLALTSFYRHEGMVSQSSSPRIRELASTRLIERARALGAAIRVAHVLSAAMPGVLGRTRVEKRKEHLALILPADLAHLGGARIIRRLSQVAKFAGREPSIEIEG